MPADTQVATEVSVKVSGTHIPSSPRNLCVRKRVWVAYILVEIRPIIAFRILVANFASTDVALAKMELLALVLPQPAKVYGQRRPARVSSGYYGHDWPGSSTAFGRLFATTGGPSKSFDSGFLAPQGRGSQTGLFFQR